jgi:hypothetical protein
MRDTEVDGELRLLAQGIVEQRVASQASSGMEYADAVRRQFNQPTKCQACRWTTFLLTS